MFPFRLILVSIAFAALLCTISTTVLADSEAKLRKICSSESSQSLLSNIDEARDVLDYYYSSKSNLCDAKYDDGLTALRALLSDSLLNDVCSHETIDSIHRFHVNFINDLTTEMSDEEIKSHKKIPRSQRLKPLPNALKVFFILFAKQVNAQCTQNFVDKIDEYSQDTNLVRNEDLDIVRNVTNLERGHLRKLKQKMSKWVFARRFSDLEHIQLTKPMPVAVPNKPKIVKLYNLCTKRFRSILDNLLESVVRLNNMGYMDNFVLSEETKGRLKEDLMITRWYAAFQYCEVMKNVDLIVLQKQKSDNQNGYPVKLGFLSEQLAAEARKSAVPIDDSSVELVQVERESVRLDRKARALNESEVRFELKEQRRTIKEALKARTSPVVMAERRLVMAALRRAGIQPLPMGIQAGVRKNAILFMVIIIALVFILVVVPVLITTGAVG